MMGRHSLPSPDHSSPDPEGTDLPLVELRTAISLRDLTAADGARELLRSADPTESWGQLRELGTWLSGATGRCPPRALADIRVLAINRSGPIARIPAGTVTGLTV
ncbi:MAG: hypothetical protein ACRC0L_12855, partial [Angustibacter sp.]